MKRRQISIGFACFLTLLLHTTGFAAVPDTLVPGGAAIALQLDTDGVYITEFSEQAPAKAAGLKIGDRISEINGTPIQSAADIAPVVNRAAGARVTVEVRRNSRTARFSVQPRSLGGEWRLGLYVKDSVAGIGTLTYYDPSSGSFGALGHAVNSSSGTPVSIRGGRVLPVQITEIRRGEKGQPGALGGSCAEDAEALGSISENLPQGVFGALAQPLSTQESLPVAQLSEVQTGPASILCTVRDGPPQRYEVEITKVQPNADGLRTLQLRVIDPALLALTGGIVQGISGAPILQNGRLVGAVTHVLVDAPERGYGIFIGSMLEAAEQAAPAPVLAA